MVPGKGRFAVTSYFVVFHTGGWEGWGNEFPGTGTVFFLFSVLFNERFTFFILSLAFCLSGRVGDYY